MRALTLHQPWATLIALGVKTVETRSWATPYRGRLLIHAARGVEPTSVGDYQVGRISGRGWPTSYTMYAPGFVSILNGGPGRSEHMHDLPLGAVVAVCTLRDVVPVVTPAQHEADALEDLRAEAWPGRSFVVDTAESHGGSLRHLEQFSEEGGLCTRIRDLEDQRPYGDFTPGRFIWLLDDVRAVTPPVPARGAHRLWRPPAEVWAQVEAP